MEGSLGDWRIFPLAFLGGCLPLREFEYTYPPAQHLSFIPSLGKEIWGGDAEEWPVSFKHRRGAGWSTGWKISEQDWLWAHDCKVSCSASLGKALVLPKDHFNSYIPMSFSEPSAQGTWISFTIHSVLQELTAITSVTNWPFHVFTFQSLSLSHSQFHVLRIRQWEGKVQRESKRPYHSNVSFEIW